MRRQRTTELQMIAMRRAFLAQHDLSINEARLLPPRMKEHFQKLFDAYLKGRWT